MKALVKIMPKKGVLDPQGKAIEKSLNQLGFSQINNVIQGKLIEIEIDSILFVLKSKYTKSPNFVFGASEPNSETIIFVSEGERYKSSGF